MSEAITEKIRVQVTPRYLADQSSPHEGRFAFAYTVRIANEGAVRVQLRARRWIISDARGRMEQVRGPGVVGAQPVIEPGEEFTYTSGCVLGTAIGSMYGAYEMERADGTRFEAEIAPFVLCAPKDAAERQPGHKAWVH